LYATLIYFTGFIGYPESQQFSQTRQASSQYSKDQKEIKVGGRCEGCEAIYESPVPLKTKPVDTLPDFNERVQKLNQRNRLSA